MLQHSSTNFRVTPTLKFEKEIKRLSKKYPSLKKEYVALIKSLRQNPTQGQPLGNNCYKVRVAIASKGVGKSGGARVITFVTFADEELFLVTIYDKSEHESVSDKEISKRIEVLSQSS